MTTKDDIIAYVNILLEGSGITISNNRLSFLVDDFIDEICIYCNRTNDEYPEQLERVTAKIIYNYLIQNNSQSGSGARVSSISEDGRTVNFDLNGIIIDEKNICVDKCSEDTTYFYEYKKQCYNNCPDNTSSMNFI